MKHTDIEAILGFVLLSFCAAFVGLMFNGGKKGMEYKAGLRIMLGGFIFGSIVAYIIVTQEWNDFWKKIIVSFASMFGYKIYITIQSKIFTWLDLLVKSNIPNLKNNNNKNEDNGTID